MLVVGGASGDWCVQWPVAGGEAVRGRIVLFPEQGGSGHASCAGHSGNEGHRATRADEPDLLLRSIHVVEEVENRAVVRCVVGIENDDVVTRFVVFFGGVFFSVIFFGLARCVVGSSVVVG